MSVVVEAGLTIQGYASLWGVADLNGDVVARGAFADSLARTGAAGVRMLHQHESRAVVGVWDEIAEDDRGLLVRGRIADWSPEARYAQALSRAGALDGLSIGFRTARARRDGRLRVLSGVELWEVSLVTFPMLPGARFQACLTSFDQRENHPVALRGAGGRGAWPPARSVFNGRHHERDQIRLGHARDARHHA